MWQLLLTFISCSSLCYRELYGSYVHSLAKLLQARQFTDHNICFDLFLLLSPLTLKLLQMLHDLKPGLSPMEQLEAAVKESVHPDEPTVVKLMIFLYAYEPKYRNPDDFQVISVVFASSYDTCVNNQLHSTPVCIWSAYFVVFASESSIENKTWSWTVNWSILDVQTTPFLFCIQRIRRPND